jgi:hypothetical protein
MIRIVHSIGSRGETVLSRCLGILPGVVLLSEINPLSVKLFPHFHPLYVDTNWFQLLDRVTLHQSSQLDLGRLEKFRAVIGALHQRGGGSGSASSSCEVYLFFLRDLGDFPLLKQV